MTKKNTGSPRISANIGEEISHLADVISKACNGHSTPAIFFAIAEVIGRVHAQNENPDLPKLMRIIEDAARIAFDRERSSAGESSE